MKMITFYSEIEKPVDFSFAYDSLGEIVDL